MLVLSAYGMGCRCAVIEQAVEAELSQGLVSTAGATVGVELEAEEGGVNAQTQRAQRKGGLRFSEGASAV